MKKPVLLAAAVFLSMLLAAGAFAEDLRLSIPLPLSGKQAKFGEMQKRSYEMAAEEINAKGGIKRRN